MGIRNVFVIVTTIACISGCSSAPWITPPGSNYTVINSKSYDKSYDKVWGNVLGFLAKENMQLKDVDKENGLIIAEFVAFDDAIADCGNDASMQTIERRAHLNILVNRVGKETVVTVNDEFKESRRMMTASDTVTCNSKGVLESRILDAAGG